MKTTRMVFSSYIADGELICLIRTEPLNCKQMEEGVQRLLTDIKAARVTAQKLKVDLDNIRKQME